MNLMQVVYRLGDCANIEETRISFLSCPCLCAVDVEEEVIVTWGVLPMGSQV